MVPTDASPRGAGFLRALRKFHAWVGLSGAGFGLLFGLTGFLQNHRSVMKIEAGRAEERKVTIELAEAPADLEALAKVLAQRMAWDPARVRTRVQAPRAARFEGAAVTAAAKWMVSYPGHAHMARATYSPGNRTVELEQQDSNALGTLIRLHKADGAQAGWILLTDAFAGAMVFMTLSGTLLWTRFSGPKLLAAGLAAGGLVTAVLVAARAW